MNTTTRILGTVFLLALSGCRYGIPETESVPADPEVQATWQVAAAIVDAGKNSLILDVRTPGEFAQKHIPGAVNIPSYALASRIEELADYRGKRVVVYCEAGGRSRLAAEYLIDRGFRAVAHYGGGMRAWRESPDAASRE